MFLRFASASCGASVPGSLLSPDYHQCAVLRARCRFPLGFFGFLSRSKSRIKGLLRVNAFFFLEDTADVPSRHEGPGCLCGSPLGILVSSNSPKTILLCTRLSMLVHIFTRFPNKSNRQTNGLKARITSITPSTDTHFTMTNSTNDCFSKFLYSVYYTIHPSTYYNETRVRRFDPLRAP